MAKYILKGVAFMWTLVLLCIVTFIALYLYNPQKVKQKLYEKSKSNTNYVFVTLCFIVGIAFSLTFVMLLAKNVDSVLSKLGV